MPPCHVIVSRAIEPRPVLICRPGDRLTIPRPGLAVGAHTLGGTILGYDVRLPLGITIPVLPAWIAEVRRP